MTAFEFFKKQYDERHDEMVRGIKAEVPVDSWRFVQIAAKYVFGGTFDVDPWANINGVSDTKEMREAGYVKVFDTYRDNRPALKAVLTAKGLKAFYKTMFAEA